MPVHVMRRHSPHLRFVSKAWRVLTSEHRQLLSRCRELNREYPSLHKAASLLQQDFEITSPTLPPISVLRRMQGLVTGTGEMEGLSSPAGRMWGRRSQASSGQEAMPQEELQESLWRGLFSDPAQWWDNRRSKTSLRHPDFRHKISKVAVWLNNPNKPAWVDSHLASWDAAMKMPSESMTTPNEGQGAFMLLGADQGLSEVGMCRKLCEDGRLIDAVDALNILVQLGCHVDKNLFYRVLKRCIADKELVLGRRIHALTVRSGYDGDAFLATHFIGLYASHGRLEDARGVFAKVCTPSSHNWATIIFAYARHGQAAEAIGLYRQLYESGTVKPTDRIYVAVLKACAAARDLVVGKEVHAHILASTGKEDIFVQTGLVNMYAKCGSLEDARRVFDKLRETDVVAWTSMIAGYAQQGMGQEALLLYNNMQDEGLTPPDSVTYVCLLQACATVGVGALDQGKQLHAQIRQRGLEDDVVVGGSLVNMYAKCCRLEDARSVFDKLPTRNVVSWTALIAGYAQQEMGEEALSLYSSMQQEDITAPNAVTFVCLLQACARLGVVALDQGKQLHAQIEEQGMQDDVVVGGNVVNMYAKCASLDDARSLFDRLPDRDIVTWTVMIAGYAQQGMCQEALSLYSSMQQSGLTPPDSVTFLWLLQACAIVSALLLGKQLHAQIEERELQADVVLGGALVNMYAKCGSMFDSQQVFNSLPQKTIETWNSLSGGYARQGDSEVVFDLVDKMRLEGIQPDGITFLNVLTVCSHVGLVDKGREYFEAMRTEYCICPTPEHYTCMMDLLGRAGYLEEALQMAKTTPFPPSDTVWLTLLGACQKWKDVEIGQQAFEGAANADVKDASSYVLMSNIYASAKMWDEAIEIQARRVKSGAWKKPGQSWWTDVSGVVHTFVARDNNHPLTEGMYRCKAARASPRNDEAHLQCLH